MCSYIEVKGGNHFGILLINFYSSDRSAVQTVISESYLFSNCCKRGLKAVFTNSVRLDKSDLKD